MDTVAHGIRENEHPRRPASPGPAGAGNGRSVGRARVRDGALPGPVSDPAPRAGAATETFSLPDFSAPVFVDRSGRRGRRLRRVAYGLVAFALVLLALWWTSQVLVVRSEIH